MSANGLGYVYVSGGTSGNLGGTNAGGSDAFVSKYDAAGTLLWTRQLGTSSQDGAYGASADGLGNVYISGLTYGNLGGMSAGDADAFVSKYDATGTLEWTRQFGTIQHDFSSDVSADGLGYVYVTGNNSYARLSGDDCFVNKYDAAGALQWTRQFGSSDHDYSNSLSADSLGNIYISGNTFGSLVGSNAGGLDAFITKYNSAGTRQWTRQFGTSGDDFAGSTSADDLGNVFVVGKTLGDLDGPNSGYGDVFVRKYDANGSLKWARQLGTVADETGVDVSSDGLSNVFITGFTYGSLGGINAGDHDAFVAMYDVAGVLQWTRMLGTNSTDDGLGVSADGLGNVYLAGDTKGSLGGPNAGDYDVFVAKFSETSVPEPSTLVLAALAIVPFAWRRRGVRKGRHRFTGYR